MDKGDNLSRNGSGYYDPTAYQAMKNVMADELEESDRFRQLLDTIFYITELAGFQIEGRIVIKDKKTGKTVATVSSTALTLYNNYDRIRKNMEVIPLITLCLSL